eukprot:2788865-Prymnesium_polylepis.1
MEADPTTVQSLSKVRGKLEASRQPSAAVPRMSFGVVKRGATAVWAKLEEQLDGPLTMLPQTDSSHEKSAQVIQHLFRSQRLMFSTFGPMLFCKHDGSAADYGQLSFLTNNSTNVTQWISLSTDASPALL